MYKNLIVPTDFSDNAAKTAQKAIALAKSWDARVHFVHVIEPSETIPYPIHVELESYQKLAIESATSNMRSFIGELSLSDVSFDESIEDGIAHETILRVAKDNKADLIVIGPHGKSKIEKFFVGSVTDRIMRTSEIDVLMIRP